MQSLDWEGPLEEGMAVYSSILAWRISWVTLDESFNLSGPNSFF